MRKAILTMTSVRLAVKTRATTAHRLVAMTVGADDGQWKQHGPAVMKMMGRKIPAR